MTVKTENPMVFLFGGLLGAILLLLPAIEYHNDIDIPLVGWPLAVLAQGATYLAVFFHEIGHAVAGWFYGYISVPYFDFSDGGGMTAQLGEQRPVLFVLTYILLAYGAFLFFREKILIGGLAALALLHVTTAYNDAHQVVFLFAGHGTEILIGSFMLFRAAFNAAPRGKVERFLNALFGFYFLLSILRMTYRLMTSDVERAVYARQKGGAHFGDFDRIADYLATDIQHVAFFTLVLCGIFLVLPLLCYFVILTKARFEY